MSVNRDWFVDINSVRTDYIRIENLKQFKAELPPQVHPNHPDYAYYWSMETKKCIEGMWGEEFSKYRYMPGNLYYVGSFSILQHTINKETRYMKPLIVDFMWDYAYDSIVCRGFSGFSEDEEINCYEGLQDHTEYTRHLLPKECFKKDGSLKKYVPAREYIEQLHDKPLGIPLFANHTIDEVVLGSRGGMKSYWVALGEIEYRFVFCDAKSYEAYRTGLTRGLLSEQIVGSTDAEKSSEMLEKFDVSQRSKMDTSNEDFVKWFGIWGVDGDKDFTPCPFYRRSTGTLDCPNKTNPYRHKYKKLINGEWKEVGGTGSKIGHVNYNPQKAKGETAGVGGRVNFSNCEEIGLMENYDKVKGHNEATAWRGGQRNGVQWGQGTSGMLRFITAAKTIFLDPKSYRVLTFPNQNGREGKDNRTARFIAYYITLLEFKDENGNTDFERAINFTNEQRRVASEADDPAVLRNLRMNYPCYTHEMWISIKGYHLPYEEASLQHRNLHENNIYTNNHTCIDLLWDDLAPNGVNYEIAHDKAPIYKWPPEKSQKLTTQGCAVIYEFPESNPPNDMYAFVGHDPYVAEELDRGGSLGCTYILKNPKYIPNGRTGNIIVASYNDKPLEGLDKYYENQSKLLALYGNPVQGLWYEKNRGEHCRNYYIRKSKMHLLAPTPQYAVGASIYQRAVNSTGFLVGNKTGKKNLLKMVNDWLLEETSFMKDNKLETKRNIFRIPCLLLVQQIRDYDMEGNYDAVSAFIGCILGLREMETLEDMEAQARTDTSLFTKLLNDPRIFRHESSQRHNRHVQKYGPSAIESIRQREN